MCTSFFHDFDILYLAADDANYCEIYSALKLDNNLKLL